MKRVVVVTGASRGIGRAIALAFADSQNFVYVNYKSSQAEAAAVVEAIKQAGGQAALLAFDIAKGEAVSQAFAQVEKEQGGIDVLVNNAGVAIDSLLLRAREEDWHTVMETNLTGTFLCTKLALKTMMRRKNHGRIINISSVVGEMGNAGQSMYAASKAGMIGFSKSLAKEVGSRGITVNVVAPGYVKTDMTAALSAEQKEAFLAHIALKRWAEPEEIANAVKFLASEQAAYITGHVLSVNGGLYV